MNEIKETERVENETDKSLNSIYDEKYRHEAGEFFSRIFNPEKFFVMNEYLAKKYIETLVRVLGIKEAEKIPAAGNYRIDKSGYCPEIAEILNMPYYMYLAPSVYYCIIVSPEQKNSMLINNSFSFLEECLDYAYNKYDETVKFITKEDIALIQLKFNVNNLGDLSKIHRLKSVNMRIDTISGRLEDVEKLKKMHRDLALNDNLLDDSFINKMTELIKKTGNIKNTMPRLFTDDSSMVLQSFYINFPSLVVALNDRANNATLLFHNAPEMESVAAETGVYPVYLSKQSVIDNLQKLKFIDFHSNAAYIDQKIRDLEELFLLKKGYDINNMSKFEFERLRSEKSSEMPELINELHEYKSHIEWRGGKGSKNNSEFKLSPDAKMILAFAKEEFNVVNKLLCVFDKSNFLRRYYCERAELMFEIEKLPLYHKYYILKKLAGDLNRD